MPDHERGDSKLFLVLYRIPEVSQFLERSSLTYVLFAEDSNQNRNTKRIPKTNIFLL